MTTWLASAEHSICRCLLALFVLVFSPAVFCLNSRADTPSLTDHFVEVDDVKLHYIESGHGPTVVLIHGNAGDCNDFKLGAIDALASSYRVIAIDRPGHGESERSRNAGTVEAQAKLLHDELAKLGVTRPILVGHSWGGSLALAYAIAYPDELSAIVLVAPAAYPDQSEPFILKVAAKFPFIAELGGFLGKSILDFGLVKHDVAIAFYPQKIPDGYLKSIRHSWFGRRQIKAFFEDEADLNDSLEAMTQHYAEIRVPTAIITGDRDRVVDPKQNAQRLHRVIKHSVLIELPNTGHEIPQTHPASILAAIKAITH